MARDPNKYRDDEDLNALDDEEEEDDFDGRPEQSGDDDDDSVGMEEESAKPVRRGAKTHTGRRDN